MTILATLFGAGLVLVALRDIFQQLFRPDGSGSLSRWLMRAIWGGFRRLGARHRALLPLAGPAVLLAIMSNWVLLLVVGWALVFWPHLPERFLLASGLDPSEGYGFAEALYLSLVNLTTLGYGDITPVASWLRLVVTLEALVGFGLLTAAISWVLSIYPVLSRRRALAQEVSLLGRAERETGLDATRTSPEAAGRALGSLTSGLISARGDLLQFPVTYYFYDSDERSSLPAQIQKFLGLAERGESGGSPPAVRLRAAALRGAVEDLSETLATRFLGRDPAPVESVLAAYARDHLRAPPGKGRKNARPG
jgi:hypothetical protein